MKGGKPSTSFSTNYSKNPQKNDGMDGWDGWMGWMGGSRYLTELGKVHHLTGCHLHPKHILRGVSPQQRQLPPLLHHTPHNQTQSSRVSQIGLKKKEGWMDVTLTSPLITFPAMAISPHVMSAPKCFMIRLLMDIFIAMHQIKEQT